MAFYNLGQYGKALEMYASGLQKFPKNAMLLSFNGNAYLALKDYKSAGANYGLALANRESLMSDINNNPRFAKTGSLDRQSYYNAAVASICYNDAACKIYDEKFNEALISMNEAIALAPDFADFNKETYYNRRAELYLEKKSYGLALADLKQSIKINKNYAPAYINRAIAKAGAAGKGQITKTTMSAKFPNQPFRISWLAKPGTAAEKADPDMASALEDCNTGIALDRNMGFSYYARGQIKYFLGYADYCSDLAKAKKMGVDADWSIFPDCNLK